MRFPVAILCAVAAFATASAGPVRPYRNYLIGYAFDAPAEWEHVVVFRDERRVVWARLNDKQLRGLQERYITKPVALLRKYPGWHTGVNPAFRIDFRPLGELAGQEPVTILRLMLGKMEKQLLYFKILEPIAPVFVSGLPAAHVRFEYSTRPNWDYGQFDIDFDFWVIPRGEYVFLVGGGVDRNELAATRAEVLGIFSSIVLSK